MARILIVSDNDPQIVVELADDPDEGTWDGPCRFPGCTFRVSESTGGNDNLGEAVQEAIVHVDCRAH